MKDVGSGMGVKNISDLVLKEIHSVLETKNPKKEQINEYNTTERELYKKFDNFRNEELNKNNNKTIHVRSDAITTVIKRCRGNKKRHKSNRWIQKKINDSRF